MKRHAECFCVLAAVLKFLFARGAIEARSTVSEPAHKKRAAIGKGRHGDAIRQLLVAALCMPIETAATAHEGDA
jgi:hypothetical protein